MSTTAPQKSRTKENMTFSKNALIITIIIIIIIIIIVIIVDA